MCVYGGTIAYATLPRVPTMRSASSSSCGGTDRARCERVPRSRSRARALPHLVRAAHLRARRCGHRPTRDTRHGRSGSSSSRRSWFHTLPNPQASCARPRTRSATSWLTSAVRVAARLRDHSRCRACRLLAPSARSRCIDRARLGASGRAAPCAVRQLPHTGRPLTVATTTSPGRGLLHRSRRPAWRWHRRRASYRTRSRGETARRMCQSRCTKASRAISLPTEITATPITMTSSAAT